MNTAVELVGLEAGLLRNQQMYMSESITIRIYTVVAVMSPVLDELDGNGIQVAMDF